MFEDDKLIECGGNEYLLPNLYQCSSPGVNYKVKVTIEQLPEGRGSRAIKKGVRVIKKYFSTRKVN